MKIRNREIGSSGPPYIIAELSANHNGSLDHALASISAAKAAGADAVKIQTYTPDTMTIRSDKDDFRITGGLWDGYTLYDLYQWAHTPYEWHQALFDHARKIGVTLFSTPFDETAVELLESLETPAYKIASFEMTDLPLLECVARTGKPIIMSTGMAGEDEITEAVERVRDAGCQELVLLHCISSYPAQTRDSKLKIIPELARRYNVLSGLSDHTMSHTAAIASVALGACVIEKHFTMDRNEKGPDSTFSLEPEELSDLCRQVKDAWESLGDGVIERADSERGSTVFRRSIYFVKDLTKGHVLTSSDIRRIRPGYGLPPKYYDQLLGRTLKCDVTVGTAVKWELIDES